MGFIEYLSKYSFVKLNSDTVQVASFTSHFDNVGSEKVSEWPCDLMMHYNISLFYYISLLKCNFYEDLNQYTIAVGWPCKSSKIVSSQHPKTASINPLDEVVYNFRKFARHMTKNITTDFDRHSVPIMFKLFDVQFEFISYWGSPVIYIHMITSNHALQCSMQSQEFELTGTRSIRKYARYIPLILS